MLKSIPLIPYVVVFGGVALEGEQVIGVEVSWMGLVTLWKKPQRVPLPVCPVRIQPSVSQETGSHQTTYRICVYFDLGFTSLQNYEK